MSLFHLWTLIRGDARIFVLDFFEQKGSSFRLILQWECFGKFSKSKLFKMCVFSILSRMIRLP